jgi:hypothetical protein
MEMEMSCLRYGWAFFLFLLANTRRKHVDENSQLPNLPSDVNNTETVPLLESPGLSSSVGFAEQGHSLALATVRPTHVRFRCTGAGKLTWQERRHAIAKYQTLYGLV